MTLRVPLLLSLLLLALSAAPAWAEPIDEMAIQGYLATSDGAALDGPVDVVATIYSDAAGTVVVHTQSLTVDVDRGFFTTTLTAIDLSIFADNAELFLGLAVNGDPEMDLIPIATTPWAGSASHAVTADEAATADYATTAASATTATDANNLPAWAEWPPPTTA